MYVNGEYVAAAEQVNGAPAYQKEGDGDWRLCRTDDGRWYVQPTASKGQSQGHTSSITAAVVPWEAGAWKVWQWEQQPGVRVETAGTAVQEITRATTEVPRSHAASQL